MIRLSYRAFRYGEALPDATILFSELLSLGMLSKTLCIPADMLAGFPADVIDDLLDVAAGWRACLRDDAERERLRRE